jgi:hypothetical protein
MFKKIITNKPDSYFSKVTGLGMCFRIEPKTTLETDSEVPIDTLITEIEIIRDDLLAIANQAQAATIRLREERQELVSQNTDLASDEEFIRALQELESSDYYGQYAE